MRLRTAATTATLSAALVFVGAGASTAAPTPGDGDGTASITSGSQPAEVVGCAFQAIKPHFITTTGPLYAQGKITSCTTPKPDACHLSVDLEKRLDNGLFGMIAHQDLGWKNCSTVNVNVPYKCPQKILLHAFRTVASLAIEYKGQYDTNVVASPVTRGYC